MASGVTVKSKPAAQPNPNETQAQREDRGLEAIQAATRRELEEAARVGAENERLRAEKAAKEAALEARVRKLEKQVPPTQRRVKEITDCIAIMENYVGDYFDAHGEAKAKVEYDRLNKALEAAKRSKGPLKCPVNKNTPISSIGDENGAEQGKMRLHPEVKIAQAQTGLPLERALMDIRNSSTAALIRAA